MCNCVNKCKIPNQSKRGFKSLIECEIHFINEFETECEIAYQSMIAFECVIECNKLGSTPVSNSIFQVNFGLSYEKNNFYPGLLYLQ